MALQQGLGILPEWWIESGPRHPADFILARKIVKFAREARHPVLSGCAAI